MQSVLANLIFLITAGCRGTGTSVILFTDSDSYVALQVIAGITGSGSGAAGGAGAGQAPEDELELDEEESEEEFDDEEELLSELELDPVMFAGTPYPVAQSQFFSRAL